MVTGFDLSFVVQTENGKTPDFTSWHIPQCTSTLVLGDASLYLLNLHCSGLQLTNSAYWPDQDGAAFGLRFEDWSLWDRSNDPSMVGVGTTWTTVTTVPVTNVVGE